MDIAPLTFHPFLSIRRPCHSHHCRERTKCLYRESLGTCLNACHVPLPSFPPSLLSLLPPALHPTADAHTYLAYLLSYEGAFEEAKEGVKKAMKVDKEFGNSWNDLGLVKSEGGREGRREGRAAGRREGRAAGRRETKTEDDAEKYTSWK